MNVELEIIHSSLTYLSSDSKKKAQPNGPNVALTWNKIKEIVATKGVKQEQPDVSYYVTESPHLAHCPKEGNSHDFR